MKINKAKRIARVTIVRIIPVVIIIYVTPFDGS